jgi:hypothetical protein
MAAMNAIVIAIQLRLSALKLASTSGCYALRTWLTVPAGKLKLRDAFACLRRFLALIGCEKPKLLPDGQGDICMVSSIDKVGRSTLEDSVGLAVMRKCAAPSTSAE